MTREAISPATDYNRDPEREWSRLEKDAYTLLKFGQFLGAKRQKKGYPFRNPLNFERRITCPSFSASVLF